MSIFGKLFGGKNTPSNAPAPRYDYRPPTETIRKTYRVDGNDTYGIEFRVQLDGTWHIFCTSHPHNPNNTSAVKCHLFDSGEVCVNSSRRPRSLDKAKAIALTWMNGYSKYIRNGGVWPTGKIRVDV